MPRGRDVLCHVRETVGRRKNENEKSPSDEGEVDKDVEAKRRDAPGSGLVDCSHTMWC